MEWAYHRKVKCTSDDGYTAIRIRTPFRGVLLAVTQFAKPIQNTRIDSTAGKKLEPISGYSARTTVLYSKTPRMKQAAQPGKPTGIVRW